MRRGYAAHPINGYSTANCNNPDIDSLCWTTQNITEPGYAYDTYPGHLPGERGYYYDRAAADAAYKAIGPEWSCPLPEQWEALVDQFASLIPGRFTNGTADDQRSLWNSASVLGGWLWDDTFGEAWADGQQLITNDSDPTYMDSFSIFAANTPPVMFGRYSFNNNYSPVRCVRRM